MNELKNEPINDGVVKMIESLKINETMNEALKGWKKGCKKNSSINKSITPYKRNKINLWISSFFG